MSDILQGISIDCTFVMMMDMPDSLRRVAKGERPQPPKTQPRILLTVQVRKQQLCLVFKRARARSCQCLVLYTKTQRQPASPQALAKQFKAH